MAIILAVFGITMLIAWFGSTALFLTFPSWFVGRLSGGKSHQSPMVQNYRSPANILLSGPWRRWTIWTIGGVLAFAGLGEISDGNLAVGIPLLLTGSLIAQSMAYFIGFITTDTRRARQQQVEYQSTVAPSLHLAAATASSRGPISSTAPTMEIPLSSQWGTRRSTLPEGWENEYLPASPSSGDDQR